MRLRKYSSILTLGVAFRQRYIGCDLFAVAIGQNSQLIAHLAVVNDIAQ